MAWQGEERRIWLLGVCNRGDELGPRRAAKARKFLTSFDNEEAVSSRRFDEGTYQSIQREKKGQRRYSDV